MESAGHHLGPAAMCGPGPRTGMLLTLATVLAWPAGLAATAHPDPDAARVARAVPVAAQPDRATAPVGDCSACHAPEALLSHPVDVVPTMTVPKRLPLEAGRVGCRTCHEDVTGAEHDALAAAGSPLLRVDALLLCSECHDPAGPGRGDMHASTLDRAHLQAPRPGRMRDERSGTTLIGSEGDGCLTCHDGTVASGVGHQERAVPSRAGRKRRRGRRGGSQIVSNSHPVGIEYPLRRSRFEGAPLHPRSSLDRRIRLFDDRVECGSCHSPYSPEPDLLVMSNFAGALCMSCHDE